MAKWIAVAVLAGLVCGCGSNEDPQTAAPAPTPEPVVTPDEPHFLPGHSAAVRRFYGDVDTHVEGEDVELEFRQPPLPPSGAVGDTITLTGSNVGVRMRVTATGLIDRTGPRRRYLAVKLRLRNTGIAVYESELENAVVRFADGRRARPAAGVAAGCSNGLEGHIRLDVDRRVDGCVLFRSAPGARPKTLLLALEQVPAAAGGRWKL